MKKTIIWLRADLRLSDNGALDYAHKNNHEILFLYIIDDSSSIGSASKWFLHKALESFRLDIKQRYNADLLIKLGKSNQILREVVRNLVKDYDVIINLIGKLFEAKKGEFSKFHHKFPEILSKAISDKQHLIHVSALGIEESCKTSIYAKTKLDGQKAIIKNSKNYNIIKPSIVFGDRDNFFNLFAKMSKTSPFLPLIGGGKAKFAPIYVGDLVESIVLLVEDGKKYKNKIFESYGPEVSSFKELMQFIIKTTGRKRFLIKLPFSIAKIQAKLLNLFKIYLLTSDQVELLKYDNIASNKHDNIDKIIGNLKSFKQIVPKYLR